MPLLEAVEPAAMERIALVSPAAVLRAALVVLADAGTTEIETSSEADSSDAVEALRRLRAAGGPQAEPALSSTAYPAAVLEQKGRADLLAGEVELERRADAAAARGAFRVALGWCPRDQIESLRARLEPLGAGMVELPRPPFVEPPTQLRTPEAAKPFRPLVEMYGTVRYRDIDPTLFTAVSYVLMFGMMFADVGHGLLLAAAGLGLRVTKDPRLRSLKQVWPVPVAAGLAAAVFGALYGEFFGPTGVIPVLWLRPLQNPIELLVAGILVGAVLLACSYVIGAINRWREGGPTAAIYSSSGLAGAILFTSVGVVAASVWTHSTAGLIAGAAIAVVGLALIFIGYLGAAGTSRTGLFEAIVETFSSVIRLGTNSISFARLAAFGMVHAAIGSLVWSATQALAIAGRWYLAIPVFLIGNAVAFTLELVVAAIQALRLEYYELYSRIYSGEGRPFVPWHLTVTKEAL